MGVVVYPSNAPKTSRLGSSWEGIRTEEATEPEGQTNGKEVEGIQKTKETKKSVRILPEIEGVFHI